LNRFEPAHYHWETIRKGLKDKALSGSSCYPVKKIDGIYRMNRIEGTDDFLRYFKWQAFCVRNMLFELFECLKFEDISVTRMRYAFIVNTL